MFSLHGAETWSPTHSQLDEIEPTDSIVATFYTGLAMKIALRHRDSEDEELEDHQFEFARFIACLREHHWGTGVTVGHPGSRRSYLFSTCSKKPYGAWFTPIVAQPRRFSSSASSSDVPSIFGLEHLNEFQWELGRHVPERMVRPLEDEPFVIHEAMNLGRSRSVSWDLPPMAIDCWMRQLPRLAPAGPRQPARAARHDPPHPAARRAYLDALDRPAAKDSSKRKHRRKGAGDRSRSRSRSLPKSEGSEALVSESDEDASAIAKYMAKYRAQEAEEFPDLDEWFRVGPRGAPSNVAKKGLVFDCVRSETKCSTADNFCLHYGLQRSFDAFYTTCRSRENANIIARACFKNMCFMASLWIDGGMGKVVFSDLMMARFEEPADFGVLAADPSISQGCRSRIQHVRALRPGPWRPLPV